MSSCQTVRIFVYGGLILAECHNELNSFKGYNSIYKHVSDRKGGVAILYKEGLADECIKISIDNKFGVDAVGLVYKANGNLTEVLHNIR